MADRVKRSKVTTRSRSRQPYILFLKKGFLHRIYEMLDTESLQEVSITNKHLRQTVLNIPDRPLLFPVTPRHSLHIEVEITRTIVFRSMVFNKKWLDTVFSLFNKVSVIEIATNDISARYKMKELLRSAFEHNISKVLVPVDCYKKWLAACNSFPKQSRIPIEALSESYFTERRYLLATDQSSNEDMLLSPFVSTIPVALQNEPWMSPVDDLINNFNHFQKTSIQLFQKKGKVYSQQQVLSLSNIFLFSPDSYHHYNIDMKQWHSMLSGCREQYAIPDAAIPSSEKFVINNVINEFAKKAYCDFGNLHQYVEVIKSEETNM